MSRQSTRLVTQVTILVLGLYCFSAVILWMQWVNIPDNSIATFKFQDQSNRLHTNDKSTESLLSAWKKHEFQCLEWVETTDEGDEVGTRRECWQRIQAGDAGYCKVRNSTSGQIIHLMHTTSLSLKDDARFTCEFAFLFSSFRFHAQSYRHDPPLTLDIIQSCGIIMAVYDRVLPSAFASIRRLRDLGCLLPIELWFRHDELRRENPVLLLLQTQYGPISFRQVFDERIHGFNVKVHALYYSRFTRVLLLDADNFAVRDPTALFFSEAMERYGAVFWPDFWHPGNSIFNLHAQSLVWELIGLEAVDMVEQESGQVLIDRSRSKPMLEQLMYYATHKPNLFTKLKLVWGDKDLFRLTWLQMRKPFFYNDRRIPGTLGVINDGRQRYCGVTMVQYDLNGDQMLFWHRNTIKLSGQGDDRRVWNRLQEFPLNVIDPNQVPRIQSFDGKKLFNETSCFGVKRFNMNPLVHMQRVEDLNSDLATMEQTLITYAREAYVLLYETD